MGSVEFLAKILALILRKFEEATFDDVLDLSIIFNGIVKLQTESVYIKMEEFLLNYDLDSVPKESICKLAEQFGLDRGSLKLFQVFEKHISLKDCSLERIL